MFFESLQFRGFEEQQFFCLFAEGDAERSRENVLQTGCGKQTIRLDISMRKRMKNDHTKMSVFRSKQYPTYQRI